MQCSFGGKFWLNSSMARVRGYSLNISQYTPVEPNIARMNHDLARYDCQLAVLWLFHGGAQHQHPFIMTKSLHVSILQSLTSM